MRAIITFLLLVIPALLYGQFGETIRSGRPGQAIGAFTVGKSVFQLQSGVTFSWVDFDESNNNLHIFNPNAVIRYGVAERIEVSGVIGYTSITDEFLVGEGQALKGISTAQVGVRLNLRDGQGVGPNIGIQSRLRLNTLSGDFDQENVGNTTIVMATQSLGNKFGLAANLGATWLGDGSDAIGSYVLNLGLDINDKFSVFIENYGAFSNGYFNTFFDTGLGYLVNPDLKLDFSTGYGKNQGLQDYFFDIGFSWRTYPKDR